MEIRKATDGDLQTVDELVVGIYVAEEFVPVERADNLRTAEKRAAVCDVFVATNDDRSIIGTVTLVTTRSEFSQLALDAEAEVRLLCVSPSARGSGAGEALIRRCLERATLAGFSGMVLSTQPTMKAAHRLYERLDFSRTPERDWVQGNGGEMLVYARLLP